MAKMIIEQQQPTVAFSPSAAASPLKIGALSYWLTGLGLGFEMVKGGAATTAYQDFMYRAIKNLQLQGGGRPYLNIGSPDARTLYWHAIHRTRGRVARMPDMQTGSVTLYHYLPLIFSPLCVRPDGTLNFFGMESGIEPSQDLALSLTWGAAASIASATNTITTAGSGLRVTTYGVVLEPGDSPIQYYPAWATQQDSPSQAFAGLSHLIKLTTGYWLRRTQVLQLLGAAGGSDVRDNGYASASTSEIAVVTKDGRKALNEKLWDFAHRSQGWSQVAADNSDVAGAALAGGASVISAPWNAGVGLIDYAQFLPASVKPSQGDPIFGVNLVGKSDGTLSLATTVDVATNNNLCLLHEQFLRY